MNALPANDSGSSADPDMEFLDQIEAFPGIEWVGSCNELNASYTADGYARLAGIAAIVTTFGPGELSAVCGLAGAMAESVPIVPIVGGPPVRIMERHAAMHHSLGDGDYDRWVRIGREVTVAQTSLTADNASGEIDRVLREGWLARRPVYIRLPGDVARQPAAPPSSPLTPPEPAVDPERLDAFVGAARQLLANATRPARTSCRRHSGARSGTRRRPRSARGWHDPTAGSSSSPATAHSS
ncbi:thiamine pyrophosphate-binding protein [Micromonospora avicenniae]|uniref:Indolepyruvate decarboxylase n=1 Tax=Micromonospora avicenniae TaxID=1198245 RepID=A0A1N6WL74_9ACTN|nr:thiamine pyrophosphate-binding protein [Micromonospora avicenniae]SIQ90746.1 indolepyruvate decarboxylase [Micromonospora avicenniae]